MWLALSSKHPLIEEEDGSFPILRPVSIPDLVLF